MRVLLFGAKGQVGWELQRSLAPLGHITACDCEEVDFNNLDGLRSIVFQSFRALRRRPGRQNADVDQGRQRVGHIVPEPLNLATFVTFVTFARSHPRLDGGGGQPDRVQRADCVHGVAGPVSSG